MRFGGLFRRVDRKRAAELQAASEAINGLSDQVSLLRDEIDELRTDNELLAHSVLIDHKTGLANASAFELDLHQLDARRRRSEQPYSVLLAHIDADNVRMTDFGEAERRFEPVADVFKAIVRQGDRAYCCEPNRIAVLLAGADLPRAVAAGERFRSSVESARIADRSKGEGFITVTVGVIEAGFRHATAKDVYAELETLVTDNAIVGANQLVWPH